MVLVSPNDWSPEHGPWEDGVSYAQQLVYDLFTNYVEASTLLDLDATFRAEVADMKNRLLSPRIGSWGQLREWMYTDDSPTDEHRHLSHLVAAYPGHQITLDDTPTLAEAVKVSLNARGIGGPGWSRSWKINLWARLREAEKAYEAINEQLKNTIYNNLFNVHPPFQIDGNFGYTAGLAEMLLQSHNGVIQFLPALPSSWPDGNVTGMCARGGFVVDMQWQNGTLKLATIHSPKGGVCKLRYGNEEIQFNTEAGKIYFWNPSLKGDFNLDNHVDMLDLSILKSEYLLQESHTESAGLVVIEAEHFTDNTPGSGSMAGSEWTGMTGSGSIGDGFMQALPDQGRSINSNLETYSPHLSYPIYFSTIGDYYLWVRGMAEDSNADTVHYGADEAAFSFDYNSAFAFPVFAGFSWSSQRGDYTRPVITVDSPGTHSLDFWMREDGTAMDRIVLTTDINYNPNSGGEPSESVYLDLTADFNADGIINLADYARLANFWLEGTI